MIRMLSYHQWLVLGIFTLGYLCIIFEHLIGINKTTTALLTASFCWIAHFLGPIPFDMDLRHFSEGLSKTSEIVFFLLGALAIVETIHVHGALNVVCRYMRVRSKKGMLWVVGFVSFFLSSVLDNLTSTIVMVVLLRRLLTNREERLIFGSVVVVAANAGGAWTPIGDLTTTMLWSHDKISAQGAIQSLFLPSLGCLLGMLLLAGRMVHGEMPAESECPSSNVQPHAKGVLIFGLTALIAVPLFKCTTQLPPFLGMLTAMCFVWLFTDYLHRHEPNTQQLRMPAVLPCIDLVSILFFLGILLCVNVLKISGILTFFAERIDVLVPAKEWVAVIIGVLSSIVDNVPLVAASMGMYDVALYPIDSSFWKLVAYCAGTGGSMLIIGSAAGIAFMGLERVHFFWYLRRMTIPALFGYVIGIAVYALQMHLF